MDCLLIGYNEPDFANYEKVLCSMGEQSGVYRDLSLNFIKLENEKYPPVGFLNYWRSKRIGIESKIHCAEPLSPAIAYLSSYLNKRGLTTVYINNYQLEKNRLAQLLNEPFRTIAITTTFYVSPMPIIEIITFIRKYNKSAKIIVGGPYISNQCTQLDSKQLKFTFQALGADFYVNNTQGEYALYRIVDALKNGKVFDDIDNIIFKKENTLVTTNISPEDNDLDENTIDWKLFTPDSVGRTVHLRTARGCAYKCAFCGFPVREGKYTYANVTTVEKELDLLSDMGNVKYLAFVDDTFNIPQERFKELCRMIIRKQYNFKWFSYLRCQFLDRETVGLMKESGCTGVFLGLESGSPQVLKNMNKSSDIDHYRKGIGLLNEFGIFSFASLIVGFPGETAETVQETVKLIEETKPTFYRAQAWYCDPITPIMKEKEKYKINGYGFQWNHATMNCTEAFDYIDTMFLTIENSIWLSQYNFDFWIIPNLLSKGMSMEQFSQYVKAFNTLISIKFGNNSERIDLEKIARELDKACAF